MPNRSIRNERNQVGPADPATRRRLLKERLSEKEPAGLYAAPAAPPPAKSPTRDLSVMGAANKLRERKLKIDKESDY